MKSTKNFFSFFLSRFYDSIKFNQSFAFRLKIYFERSTKYRQTIDILGNVYRNSKWTDLKIQNIKGSHLFKFLRINMVLITIFLFIYLILFRYNATFFYSITSELNYFWLIVSDFISYLGLVTFSIFINLYIMLTALYYYIFNSITRLLGIKHSSTNGNFQLYNNEYSFSNPTTTKSKDYGLNFKSDSLGNISSEVSLVSTLFKLKKNLDFSNYSILGFDKKTSELSANSIITSIASANNNQNSNINKSLVMIESSFVSVDFNKNFSKSKFSESLIKKYSKDMFITSIIEDSSQLTFNKASANRWILKMLPFSEDLAINSSYFSKLKENLANPFLDSKAANQNVWIGNLQLNALPTLSIANELNKSNINNFEISRLWNQKRNYFTLLSKFSESKPLHSYKLDTINNIQHQDSNFILSLINLDYQNYKNAFFLSTNDIDINNSKNINYNNFIYLSGNNLNMWNSLDKIYLNSLCSSDTNLNSQRSNYIFLSYDHDYYKYL